jgi:hypothetical protein
MLLRIWVNLRNMKNKRTLSLLAAAASISLVSVLFMYPLVVGSSSTQSQLSTTPSTADQFGLQGRLTIEVYDDGKLIDSRDVYNTIKDYGKEGALAQLFTASHPAPHTGTVGMGNAYTVLALGDSSGTPANPDRLANEFLRLGRSLTPIVDAATNCVTQTYQRGGTNSAETYREAGLATAFNADSVPLLNRVTFADVVKPATGTVNFNMQVCIT